MPRALFRSSVSFGALSGYVALLLAKAPRSKLASSGQAVLCTIHQPNAQLFDALCVDPTPFRLTTADDLHSDALLLLGRGGKTMYHGDLGDDSQIVRQRMLCYA